MAEVMPFNITTLFELQKLSPLVVFFPFLIGGYSKNEESNNINEEPMCYNYIKQSFASVHAVLTKLNY